MSDVIESDPNLLAAKIALRDMFSTTIGQMYGLDDIPNKDPHINYQWLLAKKLGSLALSLVSKADDSLSQIFNDVINLDDLNNAKNKEDKELARSKIIAKIDQILGL